MQKERPPAHQVLEMGLALAAAGAGTAIVAVYAGDMGRTAKMIGLAGLLLTSGSWLVLRGLVYAVQDRPLLLE